MQLFQELRKHVNNVRDLEGRVLPTTFDHLKVIKQAMCVNNKNTGPKTHRRDAQIW